MTSKTSTPSTIAFIGAGNMAQALIGGLLASGHPAERIRAADPGAAARNQAQGLGRIRVTEDNTAAAAGADIVVLAVKPQVIDDVLRDLVPSIDEHALIVSVAAGIPIDRLQRSLGSARPVIRAMPNTPALIGQGATGLFAAAACSQTHRDTARAIFATSGKVVEVDDEDLMDVVTAISGSGPAYFFAMTEALARAGETAGLPREAARTLAAQTAAGAGAMLAAGNADAATLRQRVTSPGGTTAAALDQLGRDDLAGLVQRAVDAAVARGRALGESV